MYRNKDTKEVLAFSEPGVKYRNDGLVDGTNHTMDHDAWEAILEYHNNSVKGNVIKDSYAYKEVVEISTDLWEKKLQRGMPVLDLHIPRGVCV